MTDIAVPRTPGLAGATRTRILLYCGVVIVVLNFVNISSGFHIIPLSFLLKNKLHLSANGLATFALWAGIPSYFSFAFGMVRDFWSPFGLGDRGYVMLFGAASAVAFAVFAFVPVSLAMLLICSVLTSICFLFLWSAWNGLGSTIGQQLAMSGRISALWNFAGTVTIFAAYALGGVLSGWLEHKSPGVAVRILFLLLAATMASIAAIGLWKPQAVYGHLALARGARHDFLADLRRLARHWPIYPALASWLLWNFSPGGTTVLQYYLSNTLHASDAQWGAYNAIFTISFVPTYVLFGYLSPRYPLSALLWWGTLAAIPQMIPLLFIHSVNAALVAAIPIGLLGGVATAAYLDLMIRACPRGLEGTLMMLAWSMFALAGNFGNLLGTNLYEFHGGFVVCVIATTVVYALILPVLALVPKKLIATPDGVALAE
ncbi:MAG TPA: MFS transporter [Rhizomicrobium sp.]